MLEAELSNLIVDPDHLYIASKIAMFEYCPWCRTLQEEGKWIVVERR
jgi:hypothetical protein